MRRKGKDFSGINTPLFQNMLAIHAEEGEGSGQPSEPQPSPAQSFQEEHVSDISTSSQPQKTQKHSKYRKLSNRVLDLQKANTDHALEIVILKKEIASLKKKFKKLEKRKRSRTQGLKLFKIGTVKRRSLDKEDVVMDESITHIEGDAEQEVNAVADEVNAAVSVSTDVAKTPTTTTLLEDNDVTVDSKTPPTTTLFEDDGVEVAVADILLHLRDTSKVNSIVFEERVKRPGPELQSDTSKKQKPNEVKDVLVTEEPAKKPTAPNEEKMKQPIKKLVRHRSVARKRKLGELTAKEEEEYEKKKKKELTAFLIIGFDDEEDEYDNEVFEKRTPIIKWNSEYYGLTPLLDGAEVPEGSKRNVVTRLSGNKRYFSVLISVLPNFDRDDLITLYQLVTDKYQGRTPEGFDLILWKDLTTMFNPNEEDDIWKSQETWNIESWKLHKSAGVHTLQIDNGLVIYMLVDKKYPLMKKVLMQMLELKLKCEDDSNMALQLIKLIKKQSRESDVKSCLV